MTTLPPRRDDRTPLRLHQDDLPASPRAWTLRLVFGPAGPMERRLRLDAPLSFGRAPEGPGAIALDDHAASRTHARIEATARGAVRVTDLASTNGTWVNGSRLTDTLALRDGDVLRLGDTILVLEPEPLAPDDGEAHGLLGRSAAMAELRALVARAAPTDLPVLVVGPTGTGKELVSQALHSGSGRRGRLVALNCAALPAGLVEATLFGRLKGAFTDARSDAPGAFAEADGGTLFLDELGELPLPAQAALLRALDSGEYTPVGATRARRASVRVVGATNVDLLEAIEARRFREDLYARLAGLVLRPPALAARRGDVPRLLQALLPEALAGRAWTADFVEGLMLYAWPRNVRELKRYAQRLAVMHPDADVLGSPLLSAEMRAGRTLRDRPAVDAAWPPSEATLLDLLERCEGNVSRVAEAVGRNRKQVYRWMDQLGVPRGTGRPAPG